MWNYCEILGAGIYEVIIAEDYKEFDLNKNDICRVSSELFKAVPLSVWNMILDK